MFLKKNFLMMFFMATATIFTSCSDDDDAGTPPVINPTGSLDVEDQALENNTVTIGNVVMSDDGWIVIYRDNAGVQGTEILGYTAVDAGTSEDVTVTLENDANVMDGDLLWAALHVDDDEDGVLDWDGTTGGDVAVRTGTSKVSESFTVSVATTGDQNSITADDQAVADNTITISNVNLLEAGWIVVHADEDGAPGEVIGVSDPLAAGSHDNVEITFNDGVEVSTGDELWIMLHADTGVAGEYEFDGENDLDLPLTGEDDNPVVTSITITD